MRNQVRPAQAFDLATGEPVIFAKGSSPADAQGEPALREAEERAAFVRELSLREEERREREARCGTRRQARAENMVARCAVALLCLVVASPVLVIARYSLAWASALSRQRSVPLVAPTLRLDRADVLTVRPRTPVGMDDRLYAQAINARHYLLAPFARLRLEGGQARVPLRELCGDKRQETWGIQFTHVRGTIQTVDVPLPAPDRDSAPGP